MQRILCIISSLTAGGAETFLMKICRALPEDKYQFDFIVNEGGGCYCKEVLERGGHIYIIPKRTKNFLLAMKSIYVIISKNKYDNVLKIGNSSIAVADLIVAKLAGATSLAMRSCNAPTNLTLKERIIHICLRPILNYFANIKIAPSKLASEFTFGCIKGYQRVHLIHNGLDLKYYCFDSIGRYQVRKEFNIQDKLIVGHIGRFHKQKNHLFLLKVFQKICALQGDAVLLLVGSGELEDVICKWITALGLEGKVLLAGQRFDIPQLLSAMDVFVFPSLHEGMPNTVIEAQATGLPCVIADTITPEADITGLVTYLPLESSLQTWAETALDAVRHERIDTSEAFISNGYDIQSVAREFIRLFEPTGSCKS